MTLQNNYPVSFGRSSIKKTSETKEEAKKNQFHFRRFPWASELGTRFEIIFNLFCFFPLKNLRFHAIPNFITFRARSQKALVPEICWKSSQLMISLPRTQWKKYWNWIIFPFSGKAFLKNCRKNTRKKRNKAHRFPENCFEWFFAEKRAYKAFYEYFMKKTWVKSTQQ